MPSAPIRLLSLGLVALFLASCTSSKRSPGFDLPDAPPEEQEAAARTEVERSPDNAEAQFALAQLLAGRGETEQALVHFDRAVELDPGKERKVRREKEHYARIYQDEARLLVEQGAMDEAARRLESADRLDPDNDSTAFLRGRVAEAQGDTAAVGFYRTAWVARPRDPDRRDAFTGSLLSLARESYERREYDAAWDRLEEASLVDPRGDFHYLKGTVAYALAQSVPEPEPGDKEREESLLAERRLHLDRAAREFARALESDPTDEDAEFNLGTVLLAGERFEEAAELYHQLVMKNPQDGDLYLALARAQSFAGYNQESATTHAVGRALRIGEPVDDPVGWARRAARRYGDTELGEVWRERRAPDNVYTYSLPGGSLVEVWFYSHDAVVEAFQNGRRVGPAFSLIAPPYEHRERRKPENGDGDGEDPEDEPRH